MDELKQIEKTPLSDSDLRKILGSGTKIIEYSQLASIPHLSNLLPRQTDYCIILYETKQNSGHWVCLLKYRNIYEFFDPYGYEVDKALLWVPAHQRKLLNQSEPYLTHLLERSGRQWIYNKKRFQKLSNTVNTCGPHCTHRIYQLLHNNMDLRDYIEYMEDLKEQTGHSYDIIVSDFVEDYNVV